MQEFNFANTILWGMAEGYASEMSAKRTAMENATKNAGEMITKLSMVYNRGRQAVITNELSKLKSLDQPVLFYCFLLISLPLFSLSLSLPYYSRHYHRCLGPVSGLYTDNMKRLCFFVKIKSSQQGLEP